MRARNLKPGYYKNHVLAELDPLARMLFGGLWCLADREGRLEDYPKRIKAEILPYDDCDVDAFLDDLQRTGFILRYATQSGRFIQVVNFKKHQNPHISEKESEIPEYVPDGSGMNAVQASYEYQIHPVRVPETSGTSTVQTPEQHHTSTVQTPEQHHASTVQTPEQHHASTVQTPEQYSKSMEVARLIPDSLIPDSLIPDSLIPDPGIPDPGLSDSGLSHSGACPVQDKKQKPSRKKPWGEFSNVLLTEEELSKLEDRFGVQDTRDRIDRLSEYLRSTGKRYRDHYATILSWSRRDGTQARASPGARVDERPAFERFLEAGRRMANDTG